MNRRSFVQTLGAGAFGTVTSLGGKARANRPQAGEAVFPSVQPPDES